MPYRALCAVAALCLSVTTGGALAGEVFTGVASHYGCGDGFHGRRTASGTLFNAYGMTAAHRILRFGTMLQVYIADKAGHRKGKPVIVRVTDRGPYIRGRVLDLSCGAARQLGFEKRGVAKVIVKVLR